MCYLWPNTCKVLDREVKHEVTEMKPENEDQPAQRDVLTFEVRRRKEHHADWDLRIFSEEEEEEEEEDTHTCDGYLNPKEPSFQPDVGDNHGFRGQRGTPKANLSDVLNRMYSFMTDCHNR